MYKIIPVLAALIFMMNTECFSQNGRVEQSMAMIAVGQVEPIAFVVNGMDCMPSVGAMCISLREEGQKIECQINFRGSDRAEYYTFATANIREVGGWTLGDVYNVVVEDVSGMAYCDDQSYGTLIYDPATGIGTLDVHFGQRHSRIRWKVPGAPFAGWTYRALVNEIIKWTEEHEDVMVCTYCDLQFERTEVAVTYYLLRDEDGEPSEKDAVQVKRYAWTQDRQGISIFGFEDCSILEIRGGQLAGSISLWGGKSREVVFTALPKPVRGYVPGE